MWYYFICFSKSEYEGKGIPAMKRIALTLLALVMLCSCVLAETAEKTEYEFEDFTFEWNAETPVREGYKVEGQSYLDIFPAGDSTVDAYPHFNVVWSSAAADIENIAEKEIEELAREYEAEISGIFEADGLKVIQFDITEYDKNTVDGKPALYLKALMRIDYSDMGEQYEGVERDLIMCQWVVYTGDKGCYTFTGTAVSQQDMNRWILPLMDSIRGK